MPGQAPMIFPSVQVESFPDRTATFPETQTVALDVQPRRLLLTASGGRPRALLFDQVLSIQPDAYRLEVRMMDGSRLVFSKLGYDYEAFLFQVYSAWNAYVSSALFVDEPMLLEVKGRFSHRDPGQPLLGLPACEAADPEGDTRFRVYDSSLMILPLRGPVRRIPLCFVDELKREGLAVTLRTSHGEQLQLSWLGYDADMLHRTLAEAIQRQSEKALDMLQEAAAWHPIDRQILEDAAWALRAGRGADWQTLESESPALTDWLDQLLRLWSPDGYYDALRQQVDASGSRLMIGIRREQPTDRLGETSSEASVTFEASETTDASDGPDAPDGSHASDNPESSDGPDAPDGPIPAFWLAAWLPGSRPAMVVELIAARPLAQATYVFAGPNRAEDWPLHAQVLNRGLEAVDFRRQPVYLPLDKLHLPEFERDLAALRFCPPLEYLRAQFQGRIIHRSLAGWQSSLKALLTREPV